jgi:hypothetical protein
MAATRRVIIVRPGDRELFAQLTEQYAGDPDTVVIYDRRVKERRSTQRPGAVDRRRSDRRFPYDAKIVLSRGFFVTRARPRRAFA